MQLLAFPSLYLWPHFMETLRESRLTAWHFLLTFAFFNGSYFSKIYTPMIFSGNLKRTCSEQSGTQTASTG